MSGKLNFLPFVSTVSALLAVAAAVIGFVIKGTAGGIGAAVGVLTMTGLFAGSTAFIIWVENHNRRLMLAAGLAAYFVKLWFLFVILNGVAASGWAGFVPMVWGVAAGVLGWIIAYGWWLWHAKIPYVEI